MIIENHPDINFEPVYQVLTEKKNRIEKYSEFAEGVKKTNPKPKLKAKFCEFKNWEGWKDEPAIEPIITKFEGGVTYVEV